MNVNIHGCMFMMKYDTMSLTHLWYESVLLWYFGTVLVLWCPWIWYPDKNIGSVNLCNIAEADTGVGCQDIGQIQGHHQSTERINIKHVINIFISGYPDILKLDTHCQNKDAQIKWRILVRKHTAFDWVIIMSQVGPGDFCTLNWSIVFSSD